MAQNDDWETKERGTLADAYEIYAAAAERLGWEVKSFEEWLQS